MPKSQKQRSSLRRSAVYGLSKIHLSKRVLSFSYTSHQWTHISSIDVSVLRNAVDPLEKEYFVRLVKAFNKSRCHVLVTVIQLSNQDFFHLHSDHNQAKRSGDKLIQHHSYAQQQLNERNCLIWNCPYGAKPLSSAFLSYRFRFHCLISPGSWYGILN